MSCWNGEIVRVAFALDCHDREVIGWVATTAGISGEVIRDMMVRCVEQRFGANPHPMQWLSDKGSIFACPQHHRDRRCAQSRTKPHPRSKARRASMQKSVLVSADHKPTLFFIVSIDPSAGGRETPSRSRSN